MSFALLFLYLMLNTLTPNDPYSGRTAPLPSKHCILYIYSTDIGTDYFKHGIYCPFSFSSKCSLFHNSDIFGSCFIHILYTGCAKIKRKIIPAPKVNMFRMLIHPSSGACDLFVELFHGFYCSGSMCVGVSLWFGCGGVVSVCRLQLQAEACIRIPHHPSQTTN